MHRRHALPRPIDSEFVRDLGFEAHALSEGRRVIKRPARNDFFDRANCCIGSMLVGVTNSAANSLATFATPGSKVSKGLPGEAVPSSCKATVGSTTMECAFRRSITLMACGDFTSIAANRS